MEQLENRVCLDGAAAEEREPAVILAAVRSGRVREPAAAVARAPRAAAVARPAPQPLLQAQFAGPGQVVARGDNAVFTVTLAAAPGPNRTVSVQFATANGSARAGVHYTAQSGILTFTGGETSKTIVVPTNPTATASRFPKPDMFSVKLSKPSGIKLGASSATATIEGVRQGLSVSPVAQAVMEGDAGTTAVQFTVGLVAATQSKPVTVSYDTVDGTATAAGGDYQSVSGTLTFAPGETSKQVVVNVQGDTQIESFERFSLRLRNPVNAPLGIAAANAYIINDDSTAAPVGQVNMAMVRIEGGDISIGDPDADGLGAVTQAYQIGKYEVTSGQYAAFLNAVAKTDPYLSYDPLYSPYMNIARTGSNGSYQYTPIGNARLTADQIPNLPVYGVNWFMAARFTNWMHNGQRTDPASTTTGVYEFYEGRGLTVAPTTGGFYVSDPQAASKMKTGDLLVVTSERRPAIFQGQARVATVDAGGFVIVPGTGNLEDGFRLGDQPRWGYYGFSRTRNTDARYFIPTRNEWHRAAYYDPETPGLVSRYWATAVRSSAIRGATPGAASNQVHHANVAQSRFNQYAPGPFGDEAWPWINGDVSSVYRTTTPLEPGTGNPLNAQSIIRNSTYLVTSGGAYALSASFYGTFDQHGNVSEIVEDPVNLGYSYAAIGGSAISSYSKRVDLDFFKDIENSLLPRVDGAFLGISSNVVSWRTSNLSTTDLIGFRLGAALGTTTGGSGDITVTAAGASQAEGAVSGPLAAGVAFTISLNKASSQPVFVVFATADNSATAGSDYVARSGVLVFEPGVTRQTVRVSLVGDRVRESSESFSLRLTSAINAKLAIDTATGTIIDDD